MQVGDLIVWERTFTEEDVRLFALVSGDQGIHHMQPDEQGATTCTWPVDSYLADKAWRRYELYRTPDGL